MSKITSRDFTNGFGDGFVDTAARPTLGWLHEAD